MFLLTMAYILGVQILYRLIYRKASMILVNNMCMLLSISMIILTRLSVSKAMSQYKILAASTLLCFIIPVIVRKGKFLKNLEFSLDLENQIMGAILNDHTDPADAAKTWLKANPDAATVWLDGVTTQAGRDAVEVLTAALQD